MCYNEGNRQQSKLAKSNQLNKKRKTTMLLNNPAKRRRKVKTKTNRHNQLLNRK
jgi:hypothetical protein